MISIRKATTEDALLLASLSIEAFMPAHGHSAPKEDISSYIEANFSVENFKKEITNPDFEYYLIYTTHRKLPDFQKLSLTIQIFIYPIIKLLKWNDYIY